MSDQSLSSINKHLVLTFGSWLFLGQLCALDMIHLAVKMYLESIPIPSHNTITLLS